MARVILFYFKSIFSTSRGVKREVVGGCCLLGDAAEKGLSKIEKGHSDVVICALAASMAARFTPIEPRKLRPASCYRDLLHAALHGYFAPGSSQTMEVGN